jgi:hypothetical protein
LSPTKAREPPFQLFGRLRGPSGPRRPRERGQNARLRVKRIR